MPFATTPKASPNRRRPPGGAAVAYRKESDPLAGFLDDACDLESAAVVGASDAYEHYTHWANRQHLSIKERLSATKFGKEMSGRFEHDKRSYGKVYKGLARRY